MGEWWFGAHKSVPAVEAGGLAEVLELGGHSHAKYVVLLFTAGSGQTEYYDPITERTMVLM